MKHPKPILSCSVLHFSSRLLSGSAGCKPALPEKPFFVGSVL